MLNQAMVIVKKTYVAFVSRFYGQPIALFFLQYELTTKSMKRKQTWLLMHRNRGQKAFQQQQNQSNTSFI